MRTAQRQQHFYHIHLPSWSATSRVLATACAALALSACEGEVGPAGEKGAAGEAGSGCTVRSALGNSIGDSL